MIDLFETLMYNFVRENGDGVEIQDLKCEESIQNLRENLWEEICFQEATVDLNGLNGFI